VLEAVVALLAVASVITVVQRFVYVYRTADGATRPRDVKPAALDTLAKGR
jgi:hypothetical protein